MKLYHSVFSLLLAGTLLACNEQGNSTNSQTAAVNNANPTETNVKAFEKGPQFSSQDAYQFIQKQVDFGPRVPGTPEHKQCGDWLYESLKEYVDEITMDYAELTIGDKSKKPCYNIFGQINPTAEKRILFLAHWDTRPWADQENPPSDQPVLGADDGASGVGVLLALAKVLKENNFNEYGIDILFTDLEDYGKTEWGDKSYAIGTRHWATEAKKAGYKADLGILLDMVGAANARFAMEGFSQRYAAHVVNRVWSTAKSSGYGQYFVAENGPGITDDHVPINQILNIPTIDIINLPTNSRTAFVDHWHTLNDNMSVINHQTLEAVGQTLVNFIYNY